MSPSQIALPAAPTTDCRSSELNRSNCLLPQRSPRATSGAFGQLIASPSGTNYRASLIALTCVSAMATAFFFSVLSVLSSGLETEESADGRGAQLCGGPGTSFDEHRNKIASAPGFPQSGAPSQPAGFLVSIVGNAQLVDATALAECNGAVRKLWMSIMNAQGFFVSSTARPGTS
jgi:hypothetical protein